MKKSDVPQDKSNLESAHFRELCYAVDENGEYTTENSTGWTPKTIALDNAIQDIKERTENARKRAEQGLTSPIEYFMELNKMDLGILTSYVGFFRWQVKRHFKPNVFKKLSDKKLQKYADAFNITVEELKTMKYED
ncbi:MAG: hypothetical protein R2802_08935 [Flavobacteriaceae bacterium]|nr:hypothetical protein [Mangrovimonas sp.]MCB0431654.1 hypothetical protein [Mangrovimonas sp.]MCB0434914.1 hypothetical protein [Mangrovimonas sp.]HPF96415.1 hypothetical protein [Mangrovimonas sp.]HRV56006.1 hypothetical protein [Mangrovimonas sp.]